MTQDAEFFNLDNPDHGLVRELAAGLSTRIFVGDNSMLSLVTLAPNAAGSFHEHPEEQWGVMLEGSGIRTQDGVEYEVKAGDFWRTPGNVVHGLRAGPDGARVLDIFSPPREAYRKGGAGFAAG